MKFLQIQNLFEAYIVTLRPTMFFSIAIVHASCKEENRTFHLQRRD